MGKRCSGCDYYTDDNASQDCPKCGAGLNFTMLGSGGPEPGPEKPAWAVEVPTDFMTVEQPLTLRLGQISSAVSFYWLFWFFGAPYFGALVTGMFQDVDADKAVRVVQVAGTVFFVLAALISGGIAGASTIKWIPQGIAVGTVLMVIWLVVLEVFKAESHWLYLVSTIFTIPGAYLGHLLLGPARVMKNFGEMA